ncbi:MAG: methionyl-tRNA formyltransferase [Chloroflexi bacterium]|nr:methionyl-tRNA formyltransferase [Chloroflexota bacterium]
MKERVLFMGTPQFAIPVLEGLLENYEVVGVVTQPDRPAGRGRRPTPSPVKVLAQSRGIAALQPASLREKEVQAEIQRLEPKVIVVAAYGEIIPPAILQAAPFGCLNIHPSLLPKHRGASPIPAAILAGEEKTGVSIMRMDEGLDTGPIIAQAEENIRPQDTAASLKERLAKKGADLLLEILPRWLKGEIQARPQDETQATQTRPLKKEDGKIAWGKSADEIWRQIRAYDPWPGSYTSWQGQSLKILAARPQPSAFPGSPGQVVAEEQEIGIITGEGLLLLEKVQLGGKREMEIKEFLRGYPSFLGSRLGV